MAGMEFLGRLGDVVPVASGVAISLKGCSGITFFGSLDNTFTLTVASSFAGSYASPGSIITHYYQQAGTNGTFAWTRQTQAAADNVAQVGDYITAIEIFGSQLADPKCYIKCTASAPGDGVLVAVLHDLTVQRKPANLAILSA